MMKSTFYTSERDAHVDVCGFTKRLASAMVRKIKNGGELTLSDETDDVCFLTIGGM
jgi:hypothetical protein